MVLLCFAVSAAFRTYLLLQDVGKFSTQLPEVGECMGWLRNGPCRRCRSQGWGGRRSSEGHAWSVVGVHLGLVLGA